MESFRGSRQRRIATFGRLEAVLPSEGNTLTRGLLHAVGKPTLDQGTRAVSFVPTLTVSDTRVPDVSADDITR